MELFDIVFFVFAFITVVSAFIVVFSKSVIYSAFSLLFTFFGVAALYVLLHADFIAVTQVLIYVGGILVLMLFGVMLTNKIVNVELKTGTLHTIPALLLVAVVAGTLGGLFYSTWKGDVAPPLPAFETTTKTLGEMLMTSYLLPFEIASVLLLVALMGAAMFARRRTKT
ncbi:MAG: NADH-quinone oxidoreductase subunit J [Bacteroidetes bacterium]|nr:NADH-quinone oxidoreductase subunit J [Bacteroidota bacterium]MCW5894011.1 NADH-quinone oxidoreductase subunit J [Bacteroidota bacterium]